MALGILGLGMSRGEATKHFTEANEALLDAQSLIGQYPRSATKVDAYKNFQNLVNGFSATWKAMAEGTEGLTAYGTYANKADQYKVYFEQLIGYVTTTRDQLGEKSVVAKVDIPPLDIPGLPKPEPEIPWATIGIVAAIGVTLWLVTSKKSQ
jgi:hypothetical protein